jgi:exodeoxyribonuclease VII large subunit
MGSATVSSMARRCSSTGRSLFYEQRGDLNFVVDFVQPEGVGALQAEFERRARVSRRKGLFAPERKRPLPRFPGRIGVVTSSTGAVWHDIQTVLARRWPLATLVLQPAVVQGPETAVSVADAIRRLDREQRLDAIIVARGGGSLEDLWGFNEEPVVRAIFSASVPVVSAVGHETDVTLADLVADVRAPTPSAAAELVSPDRFELSRNVAAWQTQTTLTLARRVERRRDAVEQQQVRLARALPDLALLRDRVSDLAFDASRAAATLAERARARTDGLAARLAALSPLATLERGYALVERPSGGIVTSAAALGAGERVGLRFRDGQRVARMEDARPGAVS